MNSAPLHMGRSRMWTSVFLLTAAGIAGGLSCAPFDWQLLVGGLETCAPFDWQLLAGELEACSKLGGLPTMSEDP